MGCTARGLEARCVLKVFYPDRDTGKRADLITGGNAFIDRGGLGAGPVGIDRNERVECAIVGIDPA